MMIAVQQQLLNHIVEEWAALLRSSSLPWGVWIRRYPQIADVSHNPLHQWVVPVSAWFLDRDGISPKSVWEYRRFIVMQCEKPWCKRPFGEPDPTAGRFFEIGQAAFAPGLADNEFYVETL